MYIYIQNCLLQNIFKLFSILSQLHTLYILRCTLLLFLTKDPFSIKNNVAVVIHEKQRLTTYFYYFGGITTASFLFKVELLISIRLNLK